MKLLPTALVLLLLSVVPATTSAQCADAQCSWFGFIPFDCVALCDLSVDIATAGYVLGTDVGVAKCDLHESGPGGSLGALLIEHAVLVRPGATSVFRCTDFSNLREGDYTVRTQLLAPSLSPVAERLVALRLHADWSVTVPFAQQSEAPTLGG